MKNLIVISSFLICLYSNVSAQLPVIQSFTPPSGLAGTVVKIYGNNFNLAGGGLAKTTRPPSDYTAVFFGNYSAYPTVVTATYIETPVPSGIPLGSYNIKVSNANGMGISSSQFVVGTPPQPPAGRSIVYLHGLGGSVVSWEGTKNVIANEFYVNSKNFSYPNVDRLQTDAVNYYSSIPTNSVVIGSSQGGLIPREMVRRYGTERVSALITVGTPHRGAPIVTQVTNAGSLAAWWFSDLLAGPATLLGNTGSTIATVTDYINPLSYFMAQVLQPLYNANNPSTNDMVPNSPFLQTLNSNPAATMPTATYAIYGLEDWNSPWRIADAYSSPNSVETGNGIRWNLNLQSFYYYVAAVAFWISDTYFWLYDYYEEPDYFFEAMFWNNVSNAFYRGYYSLAYLQQAEWDYYLSGSMSSNRWFSDLGTTWWGDDAIVPYWSEMNPYIDPARRLSALGVNHWEQTDHNAVRNRIREALQKYDIGVVHR